MIISEELKLLRDQIKSWNESGVSPSLATWHCGMGHKDKKSRYQQTLDKIKYLEELLNVNK